jgi:signal transducing adaptor molecule
MKQEGYDFTDSQTPVKREVQFSKDPNVVASQQEADDIAKAIELSLKEKTTSPKAHSYSSATSTSTSLYPSMNSITNPSAATATSSTIPAPELRRVRALYDFEAAEDNELTFKAGEIIMVIEESDPNWWRGSNQRGEGYFPANFVTADLSMEPDDLSKETKSSKKNVQFDNSHETQKMEPAAVEINEEAIDRLLFLLHEADPSDPSQDSDEMLRLENAVNQMGPLIDSELERVDRKHAQLTQLSSDLIDTINLYHSLMQTDTASSMYGGGGFPGAHQMFRPPTAAMFPGASNQGFGAMMPPVAMGMNMGMQMPAGSQMHGYPQAMNNFPQSQQPPMAPSGNFQMYQPQNMQSLPPQQQHQQQTQQPQQIHQMMPSQQPQQQQHMQAPPMGMQINPAMHPMNGLPAPTPQQQQQQQTAPLDHQQAMYMGAMYPPSQQQQQQAMPMPGGNMAM